MQNPAPFAKLSAGRTVPTSSRSDSGPYKVTAQLQRFSRLTRGLVVRVGTTLQVDLTLRVGGVEENSSACAKRRRWISRRRRLAACRPAEIANLPSGNGNFTGLIAILPGVVYNRASDGQSDSVTISGQPGTGVVYQLDGGSATTTCAVAAPEAQTRPALESIQEFQVVTNQFDAEFGAALSGVVNAVTKQGTNTYRGGLLASSPMRR